MLALHVPADISIPFVFGVDEVAERMLRSVAKSIIYQKKKKVLEKVQGRNRVREWLENRLLMSSWRIAVCLTYQRET